MGLSPTRDSIFSAEPRNADDSGRFFRAPSEIYDGRPSVSEPRKFRQPPPRTQDVCFPFEGTFFAISRAKFSANLLATYMSYKIDTRDLRYTHVVNR